MHINVDFVSCRTVQAWTLFLLLLSANIGVGVGGGDKHQQNTNNNNNDQKSSSSSSSTSSSSSSSSSGGGGCGGCAMHEELKQRNLEVIKNEVLRKLGFSHPPNVTRKEFPEVPAHIYEIYGMQADEPYGRQPHTPGFSVHEEDDEYHIKTQKVLVFAKPFPRQRHHQHHDALQLQLTDSILKYYVANATLYFYIRGADHHPLSDVHMDVYKIVRPATGATEPVLKPIWSKKQPQQYGRGEWIQLDFSETISEWFKLRSDNYGFVINATVNGKKVLITDVVGKSPYVEISTTESRRRTRRSVGLNCNDSTQEKLCCRYPLEVDFVKFGWDFIIAPKRYDAHFCSGECPLLALQKFPHSHLMNLASQNSAQPCCGPRKMSAISMLYFDENYNVMYGSLPGMVVERCGCS